MRRFDALALGPRLGAGGEADVFELRGEPGIAVKLYRADRPGRGAKLRAMVASGPPTEEPTGLLAWPRELVTADDGSVRGFVMNRFDPARYRPIHQVYNPLTRRSVAPGFNPKYLLRTARNLAATVAAVHAAGAVVGDLNESNVLVDASGNVGLVDCDSFQIVDLDGQLHSCPVGKPEFTPPELHGTELADGERHPSADVFALAVLVSLLLREGRHPFAGVWTGRGDPPDLASCARRRRLPHPRCALRPSPLAVPWTALPRAVRTLGRRSLTAPRWRATMRPSADDWAEALERSERSLRACQRSAQHLSARPRGRRCPWCALLDAGVPDPFPGEVGSGISPRLTRRAEVRRRVEPARRTASGVVHRVRTVVGPTIERVRPRAQALLRREVPVGAALAAAALVAPVATLVAVAIVAVPLTAIEPRRGIRRAARRLPVAARAAWRHAARIGGRSAAVTVALVALVWWSPTTTPFARWSPAEAAQRAAHSAAVVTAPVVAVAALRRPRPVPG